MNSLNLPKYLKAKSEKLHRQVEQNLGSEQIFNAHFNEAEYSRLLHSMLMALGPLEKAIGETINHQLYKALQCNLRLNRSRLIFSDLENLAQKPPGTFKTVALNNEAEAWGALYVTEGSTLGGRVIVKQLKRHGFSDLTTQFYAGYKHETGPMWSRFLILLQSEFEAKGLSKHDILSGTKKAFQLFIT